MRNNVYPDEAMKKIFMITLYNDRQGAVTRST